MADSETVVNELLDRESVITGIQRRLAAEGNFQPFITVSREPGSGGRPIAKEVARLLGLKFYDKRLIERAAEKFHTSVGVLTRVDERRRSGVMDLVQSMFNPDYVSDEKYFRILSQIILKLVSKGGVVILGRGANFVTPNAFGLEVQIVAPYRVRVARAVQYEHLSYLDARRVIRDVSADRAAYVKQYFGKDIGLPKYYDLTLNTTFYSVSQAAKIIVSAYKAKFPGGKIRV